MVKKDQLRTPSDLFCKRGHNHRLCIFHEIPLFQEIIWGEPHKIVRLTRRPSPSNILNKVVSWTSAFPFSKRESLAIFKSSSITLPRPYYCNDKRILVQSQTHADKDFWLHANASFVQVLKRLLRRLQNNQFADYYNKFVIVCKKMLAICETQGNLRTLTI